VERPVGLLVRIGGGVAVLGCATWIAVEGVPQWERRLFEALNGGPAGLELVLWLPMQLGSLFGPFVVGGVAWWRLRRWRPAVGSVLVGVVAWQLAKVLKAAVERGRPFSLMNDFARRAGTPYEGLGFVSGHSAVAYAVAAVVAPYVSRSRRGLIWALATVVGLSRVQVSAHMPLDVLGGAGLGFVVGNAWNYAVGLPTSDVPST
jgi:membrane-associated phospholipid phosphatase